MTSRKMLPRRKLFVAYLDGVLAGMSNGFTDDEARKLFARERRVVVSRVDVRWTGKKDVTLGEYEQAMQMQVDFLPGEEDVGDVDNWIATAQPDG